MIANVLSIAGLDPSGGAGVLADVKTISACGCFGMAVVTALTAQNTRRVTARQPVAPQLAAAQIDAIFDDICVHAVKIGMLGTAEVAVAVADRLSFHRPRIVVLDPVLSASTGDELTAAAAIATIRERLIPLATLVTPNLDEAAILAGLAPPLDPSRIAQAAGVLQGWGAAAVLIKGGHGEGANADDFLFAEGGRRAFSSPRIETSAGHGTGCALSSAIACALAQGSPLETAVEAGKAYVNGALQGAARLDVGRGRGPLDHFWRRA